MPFGDPHGGFFEYTEEGLPESLAGAFVPVKETERAVRFYTRVLKMELISEDGDTAVVGRKGFYLVLRKSQIVGVDTGIMFGVDNPYDLHRRFIDEGVIFVRDPLRGPIGVFTSFRDDDGNVLHAVDRRAMGQKADLTEKDPGQ